MATVALTIAGSDPSGGAGLQADLKTFHQHGLFGTSVVTLLTVQNTRTVHEVRLLEPAFVLAQLDAVLDDVPPAAAKTGALGGAAIIQAVAQRAARFAFPLVVDPVMVSKHGAPLLEPDAVAVLRDALLPHAFLVTPNRAEASLLAGLEVGDAASMERAARKIAALGVRHVLIKGGATRRDAADLLWSDNEPHWFRAEWIDSRHTHGSGCVYSAAITARLARGESLPQAVGHAKQFITQAIAHPPALGHGLGPVNMHTPVAFEDEPS